MLLLIACGACGRVGFAVRDDGGASSEGGGNGDDCFASEIRIELGTNPYAVDIGRVATPTGEPVGDILVLSRDPDSVRVIPGSLTNDFVPASTTFGVGDVPETIRAGLLDGDNLLDFVTANRSAGTLTLWFGNTATTFAGRVDPSTGENPWDVEIADLDGTGEIELVAALATAAAVRVMDGDGSGTGTFAAAGSFASGSSAEHLTVGDFNNDGLLDVAVTNRGIGQTSSLLGNGDGTFATRTAHDGTGGSQHIAAADLDEDGFDDVVVANATGDALAILRGSATGLGAVESIPAASPHFVAIIDVNSDGYLDLVVAARNADAVMVYRAVAPGSFASPVEYPVGRSPESLAVGDINGDGYPDIVTANRGATFVSVLLATDTCQL